MSSAENFTQSAKHQNTCTGLKKVTDDMKTHKNPNLRVQSTVSGVRAGPAPFKAPAGPPKTAPKPKNAAAAKPPVFELQLKKWVIVSLNSFIQITNEEIRHCQLSLLSLNYK